MQVNSISKTCFFNCVQRFILCAILLVLSEQHTSFLLKGWPLLRNPECFLERTITLLFWCTMGQTIGTSLLLFSFVIYYQYTRSNIFADLIIVLCCPYMMGKCNVMLFCTVQCIEEVGLFISWDWGSSDWHCWLLISI